MKKILLTGASGFIGKNLIKHLIGNYQVIAIINNNYIERKENLNIIKIDLNDYLFLEKLIRKEKPEILVHLAWITDNKIYLNSEENIKWLSISKILVDLFVNNNGKHIIVSSSCAEDYLKNTLYAKSKTDLREYCFSNYKSIDISWLKIFFTYGPGDKKEKLIPSIIESAVNNKDFFLNNPENIIDYIYIDDLTRMIFKVIDEKKTGTIEIGTGKGYKLIDIANKIYNATISKGKLIYNKNYIEKKIIISKPIYNSNFTMEEGLIKTISYYIQ
jgi:nucleoside-diphosphate-sugar epimerase